MPRDNRCMYMAHVCFKSVAVMCVGCGNVCGVVDLCKGCDGCCVSVCIVTCRAVGARVWEVCVILRCCVVFASFDVDCDELK